MTENDHALATGSINDRGQNEQTENDPTEDAAPENDREAVLVVEENGRLVTRRSFLTGAFAGGAAGLALAAGAGVGVWRFMDVQEQQSLAAAQEEIDRLAGLVDRYEKLEKIGLDAILQTGMVALAAPLELVEAGARLLKGGLEWVEGAVRDLQAALGNIQGALLWLEERVSALADALQSLGDGLVTWLGRALDNPVADALRDVFKWILDHLPFDLGDRIVPALESAANLVAGAHDLVEDANGRLLEPLRGWFAADKETGVVAGMIDSLVQRILDPLEAHLGDLAVLTDTWQQKLAAPSQQALDERAKARRDIALYKQEHGFE